MTPTALNILLVLLGLVLAVPRARRVVTDFARQEAHVERLVALRVGFFGFVAIAMVIPTGINISLGVRYASLPGAFRTGVAGWRVPPRIIEALVGDPDPRLMMVALGLVIIVGSVCAALGYRFRWSAPAVAVALLFYLGVFNSYGKVNHYHHLVWVAAVLAASGCADRFSLDARRRHGVPPSSPSRRYGLPLSVIWLILGLIYFFPGIAKLQANGLDWAFSDNLMNQIYGKWLTHDPLFPPFDLSNLGPLLQLAGLARVSWITVG